MFDSRFALSLSCQSKEEEEKEKKKQRNIQKTGHNESPLKVIICLFEGQTRDYDEKVWK